MKDKNISSILDSFAQMAYGRTRSESQEANICVMCGGAAIFFKDLLSKKEYKISGMCQKCQDKFFG